MRRLLDVFMGIGLILMPFTTTPFGERGIISYGGMLLFAWSIFAVLYLMMGRLSFAKREWPLVVVSFCLITIQGASLLYVPDLLASGLRFMPVISGYVLFLYILAEPNVAIIAGRYMKIFFLGGVGLAAYFLVSFGFAVQQYSLYAVLMDRVVGGIMALQWGASNVIAAILLLFPLIGVYLGTRSARLIEKAFYFGGGGVVLGAIFLTLSRNGIISFIVACGVLIGLRTMKSRDLMRVSLATFVVLAILLTALGAEISLLWDRAMYRFDVASSVAFQDRVDIWASTWQNFLVSPLIGVGYYGSQAKFGYTAHNIWLLTLVENGVIALVLRLAFYGLLVQQVYLAFKHSKRNQRSTTFLLGILLAILISSLVNMTFEDSILNEQYIIFSWVFYGFCLAVASRTLAQGAAENAWGRSLSNRIGVGKA